MSITYHYNYIEYPYKVDVFRTNWNDDRFHQQPCPRRGRFTWEQLRGIVSELNKSQNAALLKQIVKEKQSGYSFPPSLSQFLGQTRGHTPPFQGVVPNADVKLCTAPGLWSLILVGPSVNGSFRALGGEFLGKITRFYGSVRGVSVRLDNNFSF